MMDIIWIQVLAGFAGGAVTATLINGAIAWIRRPIIRAQLIPNAGCYVETNRGNPPTHKAKFLRLQIKNTGLSSVKACGGYVTRINKNQNGQNLNDLREVLELKWSSRGTTPRDIPRNAFFYMDIAVLDRMGQQNNILSLAADLPASLDDGLLRGKASFELEILIAADNAVPLSRKVKFEYDPTNPELQFSWDFLMNGP